jgi:WD40 repeat protein
MRVSLLLVTLFWCATPRQAPAWQAELRWTLHHEHGVQAVAFSPDGKRLLTAARTALRLWDLSDGRELNSFEGNKAWHFVRHIAWTPDSKQALLASGQYKGTQRLTLWDVATFKEMRRFDEHDKPVTRVAVTADGRSAVSGTDGGNVYVWDIGTGARTAHYEPSVRQTLNAQFEPDGTTKALDISPDGRLGLWAGGYANYQLRLFDLGTGREVRGFEPKEPSEQHIVAAVFTRDGRRILAVHSYGFIRVWDVEQATSSPALRIANEVITSVAFSKDERLALVGSYSGTLSLLDIGDVQKSEPAVKQLLVLQGAHPKERRVNTRGQIAAGIEQVALSPDGRFAAAADHDGTARVWELKTKD